MNDAIKKQLHFLGLCNLEEHFDSVCLQAKNKQPSYHRFLTDIIENEYTCKKEKTRLARITRANIPERLVMETFPFAKQPNLKKKMVMELYDSMRFIDQRQDLIFIGPTGCGKTGLATSFLLHALNHEYRGYFIDFHSLTTRLRQSIGDHTENRILKRFLSYDIMLIDEMGYDLIDQQTAGLFFTLMKQRNKKCTTIITSQLGFDEWDSFLPGRHMTAALLDRITVNCTVFNMKKCISIRPKNIAYATNQNFTDKRDKE